MANPITLSKFGLHIFITGGVAAYPFLNERQTEDPSSARCTRVRGPECLHPHPLPF